MRTTITFIRGVTAVPMLLFFMVGLISSGSLYAQAVLFDFNTAPVQTSLPVTLTENGITAYLSATGSGFSIQQANVLGFTPVGFDGLCIYPNSVFAADLLISFNQTLSDFSIMYSPQELGCDDSATMRVTAYMDTNWVGTNTATVLNPGTWPTGTLSCSFPAGFNNVIVHYASHPPTCQDYGVIFMADNMQVTPINMAVISHNDVSGAGILSPNPITQDTVLSFYLEETSPITVTLFDLSGKAITTIHKGTLAAGPHILSCPLSALAIDNGLYLLKVSGSNISHTFKVVVMK
ncbi:T9SS type A sorting domain-containing protein [Flavobacterium silvisoli]|uniref:T9SS type A sorting domain-containing protein n=1 Tax=Flavobacterium silvisoli TaxID=2529433 RepID=A0A4Q9Z1N2_9FLAO|nr:T9SS type A sorting domain-containing protein [Flavobacterium silvisoli]TBX70180.1 T9SS type A sorting domain-containing protein [Flavobacterium silvisoli]